MPKPTDHRRAHLAAPRRGEAGHAIADSLRSTAVVLATVLVAVALLAWAGVHVRGQRRDRIAAGT